MNKHVTIGIVITTLLIVTTTIVNYALPKTSIIALNQYLSIAILLSVIATSAIYIQNTQTKNPKIPHESLATSIITIINQGVVAQDKRTQEKLAELKKKTEKKT